MPNTIGSNIASLKAQGSLAQASFARERTLERLSSGMRINRAGDDAAGLAIASQLKSDGRVYAQAIRNISDGVSFLSIAQAALEELSAITIRQREIATQAAQGVYGFKQRQAMHLEYDALVKEYNRIVESTSFNGLSIFDGASEISIQAGRGANAVLSVDIGSGLDRSVGDGTFTTVRTFGFGAQNLWINFVDMDNDGSKDFVTGSNQPGYSYIHLMNSDGTLKSTIQYDAPPWLNQIYYPVVGNFDADRNRDIVGWSSSVNSFYLFRGNGDGSVQSKVSIGTAAGVWSMQSADMNGDGIDDIVVGAAGSSFVLQGTAAGTFVATATFGQASTVQIADFDRDGRMDIAARFQTTLTVYRNDGNGGFNLTASLVTEGSPNSYLLEKGDINLDGFPDLVTVGDTSGTATIYLGNGDGTFNTRTSFLTGVPLGPANAVGATLGDTNGDGNLDLLVSGKDNKIYTHFGNGDGTFRFAAACTENAFGKDPSVLLHDFDGDGQNELISMDHHAASYPYIYIAAANRRSDPRIARQDLTSREGALVALDASATQLGRISKELGRIGAHMSRLDVAKSVLDVTREQYSAARSRIEDADIAVESAELVRQGILQRASSAILAQANIQPQLALLLLK